MLRRLRVMILRFSIVLACLVVLDSSGLAPAPTSMLAMPAVIADADWPQLGRDPQRTSASPQSVNGPYRFYWRWTDVPLASRAQPVVADGRLFVGALTGVMYALDAAYDARGGSPRVLWQRSLSSPIRGGAGVAGDVVVVGTHHGAVYGLEVTTGQPRWVINTGGAILASPLISNGVVYLGSADGSFYAVRTGDGALLWKHSVGAPILGSAALSGDGTRLFFVAEDVRAYALAVADGAQLWQTQLQGQGGADRWPVVLGDLVVFRTQPIGYFHDLLHRGDTVMDSAGARQADWAADWALVRPRILAHLAANPIEQTLFALDSASGQSRGSAPVLYTFGNNDAPAPPVVYNQALYLPYRARHGIQNDSPVAVHVSSQYDADLGRMDPDSLDITGVTTSGTFNYQYRLTSDEPAGLTVAGDLLLSDNWERLGGVRLTTGALVGIAQVAHESDCFKALAANSNLPAFADSCPLLGPGVEEGHSRTGATVGSGRIFWHVAGQQTGGGGLAAIGPAGSTTTLALPAPTPRPTAVAFPAPNPVSSQLLASYVWTEPQRPAASPASDLVQRLEQEIDAAITSGQHLLPFYVERGFRGPGSWPPDVTNEVEPALVQNSKVFWYDPGELVISIAAAYPYLNPTLQSRVRSYLQAEMKRLPPLRDLPYPATSWLVQGQAREPFPLAIRNSTWNAWPPPATPIQTIYAIWAYGRYTGDWSYVSSHWSEIGSLFYSKRGSINSYAEIAGAIGYARIARQLGYSSEASVGEATAVAAMQAGLDFAAWRDHANSLYPPDPSRASERPGLRGAVFFGLTPEVGRYLHDTNLAASEFTLDDIAGYPAGSYLWYATRVGTQAETGETSYQSPELAWSVFLSQAYIRQVRQPQLRYWLDRPWGLGDPWYLQKVVATLEAPTDEPFSVMLPAVR